MQVVTFINNRGQTAVIKGSIPFLLSSLNGLGDVDADIQMQRSPFQDGGTYTDSVLEPRPISMEVTIISDDGPGGVAQKRSELAQVFNPKLGLGKLTYENENGLKEIMAVPEHVPVFPSGSGNRGHTFQKCIIDLIAPNPYWKSVDQVEQMVVFEGGLTFPLRLPTTFATQSGSKSKLILNEGDVGTPIEVTFTGPATAPITIKNETTGKMIEVNQSLLDGEKLVINTEFGKKRVTKINAAGVESNAFNQIKIAKSELFQLIAGNNLLSYSTGQDYERAPVIVKWQNRYLAV